MKNWSLLPQVDMNPPVTPTFTAVVQQQVQGRQPEQGAESDTSGRNKRVRWVHTWAAKARRGTGVVLGELRAAQLTHLSGGCQ